MDGISNIQLRLEWWSSEGWQRRRQGRGSKSGWSLSCVLKKKQVGKRKGKGCSSQWVISVKAMRQESDTFRDASGSVSLERGIRWKHLQDSVSETWRQGEHAVTTQNQVKQGNWTEEIQRRQDQHALMILGEAQTGRDGVNCDTVVSGVISQEKNLGRRMAWLTIILTKWFVCSGDMLSLRTLSSRWEVAGNVAWKADGSRLGSHWWLKLS